MGCDPMTVDPRSLQGIVYPQLSSTIHNLYALAVHGIKLELFLFSLLWTTRTLTSAYSCITSINNDITALLPYQGLNMLAKHIPYLAYSQPHIPYLAYSQPGRLLRQRRERCVYKRDDQHLLPED